MCAAVVSRAGVGVHSGLSCAVQICAASPGQGVIFRTPEGTLEATVANIDPASENATDLRRGDVCIRTVEHLMGALAMLGIGDAEIRVEGPEIPILDGSARPWVEALVDADMVKGRVLGTREVTRRIQVSDGNATAVLEPLLGTLCPEYGVELSYPGGGLDGQRFTCRLDGPELITSVASARTYVLISEVAGLRDRGLARGGSMDCALVIGDDGPLNPQGARFCDEPARHKLLDLVGDLALLGYLPRGRLRITHPGHRLNHLLAQKLASM